MTASTHPADTSKDGARIDTLPPLPEPFVLTLSNAYSADQMRAYARATVAAERERCAQQLDALGCDHCAAALRNATEAPRC